ncbi:MAG: plasmid recombination protein [Clostridiales bacterium]|nr:plasmid recombination protein [Clostridiales bacterium]
MSSVDWKKYHGPSEVKAKLRHNDKESRMAGNHSNPDINKSRTHLNLNLTGRTLAESEARYDELVEGCKANMKRVRSDAVTCIGLNIKLPPDYTHVTYETQVEWVKRCYEVVKDFVGEERIVSATADFDEIHWYTDEKTHERKLSRPELDVRFVPELDGKLNAKKVESRQAIHELNDRIEAMSQMTFGINFMTGEEARHETTESLKVKSMIEEKSEEKAEKKVEKRVKQITQVLETEYKAKSKALEEEKEALQEERVGNEEQYRQDEAELEEYFLTRQAALEQARLEEQLESEAWDADLTYREEHLSEQVDKAIERRNRSVSGLPSGDRVTGLSRQWGE